MQLIWEVDKEYGFVDITPRDYDEGYFNKYKDYAKTPMGKLLTDMRIAFIDRWHTGKLLDVGIGSGMLVNLRKDTFGYDINLSAIELLKSVGKYRNIFDCIFPAYSFFDSFEHIKDHSTILNAMPQKTKVFISLPIFKDASHALKSKHFRRDEHYWYFTPQGIIRYMAEYSFACLDIDNFETRTGREDILSFVFEKR
jgi:hypothetical protein